ncbi:MAG TPA: hypothetical protein VIK04_00960 [Solirubrobacteraceae bacterium]
MSVLGERLPGTWSLRTRDKEPIADNQLIDALVNLTPPDGEGIVLGIEVKRAVTPRDVQPMLDQITSFAATRPMPTDVMPVLVARYLPESTRERIATAGAGYIDATGNIRIVADRPALFLSDRGADSDPWRGPGRPRSGLRGEPAARVVRALVDFAPPYTVPELAERAGSSTGATYRVIDFLEQEDLITRQAYGPITDVRWRDLLMRWSEDYRFAESNAVSLYLEPRGLGVLVKRLEAAEQLEYVVTGSLAAARAVAFAPSRQALIYADDPQRLVQALELRPTDTGANVVVAAPRYDVVFSRAETMQTIAFKVAALSQVVVDLLSGPGRNPNEAIALLDWMEANEPDWRR